jgi:nucleotide-binding universal stress UspA family protein
VEQGRACVLAATDFSIGALNALEEGRWIAWRGAMDLQVLHVAAAGTPWHDSPVAAEWLRAASLSPSTVLVRRGLAWVEIVRHAREVSAALIVIGTHGSSGVQTMNLGSTATRVATGAGCPVLFVPGGREWPAAEGDEAIVEPITRSDP